MNTLLLAGLVLSIVQILKTSFKISSRYIPLVSLILMAFIMLFAWIYTGYPKVSLDVIVTNLVAVLTAMGLYSGAKATIGK